MHGVLPQRDKNPPFLNVSLWGHDKSYVGQLLSFLVLEPVPGSWETPTAYLISPWGSGRIQSFWSFNLKKWSKIIMILK